MAANRIHIERRTRAHNEKVHQCNHWIAVEEIYNAFQKQMSESSILTHHEQGGHESFQPIYE
jgi:DNA-binding GntR family transcriptional regulator